MAGLGGGLLVFLVLGITGLVGPDRGAVLLVFVQFLALLAGGYVAGRFAATDRVLHGGMAALLLFFVSVAITVAISTTRPSVFALAFLGVTAAVLGSAGGVLAERRLHE